MILIEWQMDLGLQGVYNFDKRSLEKWIKSYI
ncbi:hypothetical protein SDC9_150935 [bioreactor metagenome]|uniref:Uncharacterized protein n=1 Tax=bioreactor metagenome TaxID=1076179 RepID=A0A645ET57_9ZZZZ